MSRAWQRLPERGSIAALALIAWIGMTIGRTAGRMLLYPIAFYFLVTARGPRRGSYLFLRRVLGGTPRWWQVFRHMYSFAATILDRVFLLAGQIDRYDIRVHDGQIVLDQVATGRGCILLGSHLGSFEVLRALGVTLRRIPLKVLMDVDHNPDITRFVAALNREVADTIIPVRGAVTFLELKEKLDQGYVIGMLGDRVASDDKVVTCRFLGVDALFPTSAMLLAATAASPIILVFGLYRGGNRYDVHFERLTDGFAGDRLSRQDVVRSWTQHYAGRLEHYTRLAPYNWFNFYDFWGEDEAARG